MLEGQLEDISSVVKRYSLVIPADKVQGFFNMSARNIEKVRPVKGYRPGKAPLNVIKSQWKDYLAEEVEKSCYRLALDEFFKKSIEAKWGVCSQVDPKLESPPVEGEQVSVSFEFETTPKIDPKKLEKLSFVAEGLIQRDESLLDKVIQNHLYSRGAWRKAPENATAQEKQAVSLEYFFRADSGEVMENPQVDYKLEGVLGVDLHLDREKPKVLGKKAGEEWLVEKVELKKQGECDGHHDHHHDHDHTVTIPGASYLKIVELYDVVPAEKDAGFAEDLGFASFEDYKADLSKRIDTVIKSINRNQEQKGLIDALAERLKDIEIAASLIERAKDAIIEDQFSRSPYGRMPEGKRILDSIKQDPGMRESVAARAKNMILREFSLDAFGGSIMKRAKDWGKEELVKSLQEVEDLWDAARVEKEAEEILKIPVKDRNSIYESLWLTLAELKLVSQSEVKRSFLDKDSSAEKVVPQFYIRSGNRG